MARKVPTAILNVQKKSYPRYLSSIHQEVNPFKQAYLIVIFATKYYKINFYRVIKYESVTNFNTTKKYIMLIKSNTQRHLKRITNKKR